MITPDMIPDESVEAAAMAFAYHDGYTWGSSGLDHDAIRETARAAIAAALNAWPGAALAQRTYPTIGTKRISLPVPLKVNE